MKNQKFFKMNFFFLYLKMAVIDFFLTFLVEPPRGLSNNELYMLRREVATIMFECGFGDIIDLPGNTFRNTHATPIRDTYNDLRESLDIFYNLPFPLTHGDIGKLTSYGIPRLINTTHMHNGISFIFRLNFVDPDLH